MPSILTEKVKVTILGICNFIKDTIGSMLEFIEIQGRRELRGSIKASGAKNAALPMLFAALLTSEKCVFKNVPNLEDVRLAVNLLQTLGAELERSGDEITVFVPKLLATETSYSLVKSLRASFWVLAPLIARGRAARVALPGGDMIGARPVDMHLAALTKMGADIKVKAGVVYATASAGLKPATHDLKFPSVGATHQIIMAASLTPGVSIINGAAREPEVQALAHMINNMGGEVEGAGTSQIVVRGKAELGGTTELLIGDRIEAGSYLLAAIAAGGKIRVEAINPDFFGDFLPMLTEMGAKMSLGRDFVELIAPERVRAITASTGPFPAFATDLQAPLMAALTVADGISSIEETIFEGRFGHVSELCRLGASIEVRDKIARITGAPKLAAAPVEALDIRAGFSLVVAALAAEGTTQIHETQHLRRGYEDLERKLGSLDALVRCKLCDAEDFVFTGC